MSEQQTGYLLVQETVSPLLQPQLYLLALVLSACTELGYHYNLQVLFIQRTMKQRSYAIYKERHCLTLRKSLFKPMFSNTEPL